MPSSFKSISTHHGHLLKQNQVEFEHLEVLCARDSLNVVHKPLYIHRQLTRRPIVLLVPGHPWNADPWNAVPGLSRHKVVTI